jgi:hypothetical protein
MWIQNLIYIFNKIEWELYELINILKKIVNAN